MNSEKVLHTYKDLIVWQRAVELSVQVYVLTEQFPREELYGLVSQMRRASVSIASNIAEGRRRGTRPDFVNFLRIAYGSAAELETQCVIARRLPRMADLDYTIVDELLQEVQKMLAVMIRNINPNL